VEEIPRELKDRPQWVCYQEEERDGKFTKPPRNPTTGKYGSSTNPATWAPFDVALKTYQDHPDQYDGIGYVFTEGDPYTGVDFDNIRDPVTGELDPTAQEEIVCLKSYSEVSPSGSGVHVLVRASLNGAGTHKKDIGIFDRARFFCMTGQTLPGTPREIADRQAEIDDLYARRAGVAKKTESKERRSQGESPTLEDSEILKRARAAKNGAKFAALYAGDWSGYPSQSEGDLAFCQNLAFWTQDPEQIDRIFRTSGLYRDKWDRADYMEGTIRTALDNLTDTYQAHRKPRTRKDASKPTEPKPEKSRGVDLMAYNLTDAGNAERLVALHGQDIRYCGPLGKWFVREGQRWAPDERGAIYQLALDAVRQTHLQALLMEKDPDRRKSILDKALGWEQRPKLEAMVALARYNPNVSVLPQDFDRDRWAFNVLNGTIDLRTGDLRPHRREDLITKLAPVHFDPKAQAPLWEDFLSRIMAGNQSLIFFLQKWTGYALTGDTGEQILLFLYGTGANGKSTCLVTLLNLFGDYGKQAAPSLLIEKKNDSHPTEVADLRGARLVVCVEVGAGRKMAEVLVKQLTGGDKVKARFMRQDFFEFEPTHKIVLAANHKPVIRGTDNAIWRRIRQIPFEVTIPPEEQDPDLTEKLKAELPGILTWAVQGCLAWRRERLTPPMEVVRATEQYRDEMDILWGFLAEKCLVDPQFRAGATDLYRAYAAWAEANGERAISQRAFGFAMEERGLRKDRSGPRGAMCYHGVGLQQGEP
jgi:putative DNA primase/helicase